MAQTDVSTFTFDSDWNWLYIDGERVTADDRERIEVTNPATGDRTGNPGMTVGGTGDVLAGVPAGTRDDVDQAFEAATVAQTEWAAQPPQARAEVIQGALHLLHEHEEEIAEMLVAESGSTRLKAGLELGQIAP